MIKISELIIRKDDDQESRIVIFDNEHINDVWDELNDNNLLDEEDLHIIFPNLEINDLYKFGNVEIHGKKIMLDTVDHLIRFLKCKTGGLYYHCMGMEGY